MVIGGSCYYQLALRPLLAWDAVLESARDLMHVLSSNFYRNMDDEARDSIHRVFWACSILLQYVFSSFHVGGWSVVD